MRTVTPAIIALTIGFIVTYTLTQPISRFMQRHGKVGIDIHKPNKPKIPEMCGLSIVAGVSTSTVSVMILNPEYSIEATAFLYSTLTVAAVGLLDDTIMLGPKMKPFLTALGAIPILILGVYNPHPILPFIGGTRLTIIYPILIPIALAVTSNAVNMLDVYNGSMTGTCSAATASIILCMFLVGRYEAASLAAGLLGGLFAFHIFNRYPAKVFSGDVGSLYVGASIGVATILGRVEVAAVVAMMPHIMNAFYGLAAMGGLYERMEVTSRPVRVLEDGRLEAAEDPKAPVTLARMVLANHPMMEYEVTREMILLSIVSGLLALATQILTVWW
ncbi:MAG: MraY family glycosyltransferase [Candidatus Bathyarchaeia archaeon]